MYYQCWMTRISHWGHWDSRNSYIHWLLTHVENEQKQNHFQNISRVDIRPIVKSPKLHQRYFDWNVPQTILKNHPQTTFMLSFLEVLVLSITDYCITLDFGYCKYAAETGRFYFSLSQNWHFNYCSIYRFKI